MPDDNSRALSKLFTISNGGENEVKITHTAHDKDNSINMLVKIGECLHLYQLAETVRHTQLWLLT